MFKVSDYEILTVNRVDEEGEEYVMSYTREFPDLADYADYELDAVELMEDSIATTLEILKEKGIKPPVPEKYKYLL